MAGRQHTNSLESFRPPGCRSHGIGTDLGPVTKTSAASPLRAGLPLWPTAPCGAVIRDISSIHRLAAAVYRFWLLWHHKRVTTSDQAARAWLLLAPLACVSTARPRPNSRRAPRRSSWSGRAGPALSPEAIFAQISGERLASDRASDGQ